MSVYNLNNMFENKGFSTEETINNQVASDNVNCFIYPLEYYANADKKGIVLQNLASLRKVSMDDLFAELNKFSKDQVMELIFNTAIKQNRKYSLIKNFCSGKSVLPSLKTLDIPRINKGFKIPIEINSGAVLSYESYKLKKVKGFDITVRGLAARANGFNKTPLSFDNFISQHDTDISVLLSVKVKQDKNLLNFYACATITSDNKIVVHETYLLTGELEGNAYTLINIDEIDGSEELKKSLSKITFLSEYNECVALPKYFKKQTSFTSKFEKSDDYYDDDYFDTKVLIIDEVVKEQIKPSYSVELPGNDSL